MTDATPRGVRLDVLCALRATVRGDLAGVRRIFATTADREAAFIMALRLCLLAGHGWHGDEVDAFLDRMFAEEMAEDVDRLP